MQHAPSQADYVEAFRDAMKSAGVPYSGDIVADGDLHRVHVDTDKRGARNGWYVLHLDARPAGAFGSWKGATHKWTAEGLKPLTPDERAEVSRRAAEKKALSEAAERERWAAAALAANAMWDAATEAVDHPYLARKGVPAYGLRVGVWVKDLLPGENGEARQWRTPDALLIPMRDEFRNIVSLQAVFAKPVGRDGDTRDKDFVYGGRKRGCWFTIGKPSDVNGETVVVICEGYATGAKIHQASGLAVVVAFDAGNLAPVAETVRRLMPDARLVIAADNDAWTVINGEPTNVGLLKASAAAELVGAWIVAPTFADVSTKPTDFNDLGTLEGIEAVRHQIMALFPPVEDPDEPPPHEDAPWEGEPQFAVDTEDNGHSPPEADEDDLNTDGYFRVLGHDRDSIYVYQYKMKLILRRAMADWSEAAMMTIAPLQWWEREFPGEKGMNKKMGHNWLIRRAEAKGFFDPNCRRGRGAWSDDGRTVYHFGDRLMIDGVLQDGLKINSNSVYEQARRLRLPDDVALTAAEGKIVLEACQAFHWARPASAILLAGWCALAPLCGALRWRPHIWLTGGAGSGKAQPHTAGVLTPDGWRTMGDLRVGDYVTTPDNGYAKVMGLYPQGQQPVFKITFADGRTTRATGDHLWKVRVKGAWRLRTTEQMIEVLARDSRASISLAVPLAEPLTVRGNNPIDLPLHPYALGALLGDGYLADGYGSGGNANTTLTSFDPEIAARVHEVCGPDGLGLFDTNVVGRYRFGDLSRHGRAARKVIQQLRLLGRKSHDKFIPQEYLDAPVESRIELLKGLMDTDGTICAAGSMSYCTVSPQLRDDVVSLVRSLGGTALVGVKQPTYTLHGEKRQGRDAYNISIRLRDRTMAFYLKRKADMAATDYQYADCLYLGVDAIEPDGEGECSCIAVDHPDRLYVTDNYVVTHNTTILDVVLYLMNGAAIYAQGNSTEAGIRQTLKMDALPVLFDESEQNNEREQMRVQSIISLIRQASTESEAKTLKGTQGGEAMDFMIRSMFCLSSIQVGLKHQADVERLSVLSLRPKSDGAASASENWIKISGAISRLKADPTLPGKLMRRSLTLLPITIRNIEVFAQAAAEAFGSQRDGDQYGAMLAGAWSLFKSTPATLEDARAMIARYDWSDYLEGQETEESSKALAALLGTLVRVKGGIEVSVYELVAAAADRATESCDVSQKEANGVLRRYGMQIEWRGRDLADAVLLIAYPDNVPELAGLMADTPYAADIKGQLLRVPGATRETARRFLGTQSRCVGIPMTAVIDGLVKPPVVGDDFGDDIPF